MWGVANELIASGRVDPGWLGITTADSPSGDPAGALVSTVTPGGPAAVAGIEDGDIVTAVGGDPVRSGTELDTRLYADAPGSQVTLTLDRAGATIGRTLDLTDADPDAPEHAPSP